LRATLGTVHVLDVLGILDGRQLPGAVHRVRWTPLRGCRDWDTARARAAAMTGATRRTGSVSDADHWAAQGERVLAPLLHAAARCTLTLREVVLWTASADTLQEPLGLLDELEAREAHAQLRGVLSQAPKPRDSILATVTAALHPYAGRVLDEAAQATEADWSPEEFLSGPHSLFVIAPVDGEADQPAPIVVGLLSELYGAVRRLSDANGGRLPHPALWVLDEVADISPLPKLPQWMAESAGRGLTFLLGAQDYAQLAERWGKDGATAMWSNLTNKVVFPGISNPDTLRQLEQLAGTWWETQTSSTTTRGHRRQQSHSSTGSQIQLPRWTQDALYGLPANQCLVFRPDWPHPYLQPQSRAYLTEPFSTWARMPWPIEDGELTLAGRAAKAPTPASAPPPR
jgi:type IV secretory pathway TraG/TraD family ATPase VirD4